MYGLGVESDIEIEEAYSKDFDGDADVKIAVGHMPPEASEFFQGKELDEACSAISGSALICRVPGIADYWISKEKITVAPFEGADQLRLKSTLLGSAFGYCMFLRKQVLLHGGAVACSDGGKPIHDAANGGERCTGVAGIIITGESGAGKSTVLDALMERGYKFIADDVCSISESADGPHINMAYPQKKLCRDAAIAHGYDLSKLIYIGEDRDKFAVRLSEGFLPEGADFRYLFELVVDDQAGAGGENALGNESRSGSDAGGTTDAQPSHITVREVSGHEKLKVVLRNIYRGEDEIKMWGISPEYMQACLKIASTVQIFQIVRPRNGDTLAEIMDFICGKIGE